MSKIRRSLSTAAFFAGAFYLLASEFQYLPEHVGKVEPIAVANGASAKWELSAAEVKAFTGNLAALRDSMLAQPVFNPPKGFLVSGDFRVSGDGARAGIPVRGWGRLFYHPYVIMAGAEKKGPFAHEFNAPELYLYVNDPAAPLAGFNGGPYFPSEQTPVLFEPHKVGEQNGLESYTRAPGDQVAPFLIITRTGKPVWVPLTKEAFLQILIKHRTARRAAGDNDYRAIEPIDNMRAALAKMTPAERREQAIYMEHYDYSPPLAPLGTRGAVPLVTPNPELFAPALPRTSVQLIIADFHAAWNLKHPGPDQWGNHIPLRHAETLATSDWKAIGAIMNRR
jgi:hypothetical protein